MSLAARLIAFYLPQFHPIPENDEWWGKGFTEWTNVVKARPLFKGHYQPRLPADLGFYDLRVPEVREAQAELARSAGIEGFCYYHYWFAGRRLLERPFNEVVSSGKPDFPFCLCWANESWSGIWHGAANRILVEQTYPGTQDNRNHFFSLLDAFRDDRYIRVDGRPVFLIYRPLKFDGVAQLIEEWQELAVQTGLPGMHFVAHLTDFDSEWDFTSYGFDACVMMFTHRTFKVTAQELFLENGEVLPGEFSQWAWRQKQRLLNRFHNVRLYRLSRPHLLSHCARRPNFYPTATPNWDNTPRTGTRGYVLHESTPDLFRLHLRDVISEVSGRSADRNIIFVKSWNEWAEGNYLEPDQKFGHSYLDVMREEVITKGDPPDLSVVPELQAG